MNKFCLVQAFKVTIPVLFGYLAIGIPFGLMLVNAGYPWWLAPIMSVLMYAGAGQYMAVSLFATGAQTLTRNLTGYCTQYRTLDRYRLCNAIEDLIYHTVRNLP